MPIRLGQVMLAISLSLAMPGTVTAQGLLKQGRGLLDKALENLPGTSTALTDADIDGGLREALRIGSERVVASLSQIDAFNADPDIHIPLPGNLANVQSALSRVGLSALADDLELRMNRAAELAIPHAKELFFGAISQMTLEDARGILTGPEDAATRFFQDKMTAPLTDRFTPIVNDQLAEAGAIRSYDRMLGDYKKIPFVPSVEADLSPYVVEKALDGLFLFLGREEAAIRADPAKRTTDLLRKVFGA